MSVREASRAAGHTTVYYVKSYSNPDREYTVIHVHTKSVHRWICNCPHFYHRQMVLGLQHPSMVRHCKHIKEVRTLTEMGHKIA